jgi:uncharacterized protein YxeA
MFKSKIIMRHYMEVLDGNTNKNEYHFEVYSSNGKELEYTFKIYKQDIETLKALLESIK